MKIKNVEIYNFRAFSDVNKATFDFTNDGEALDFISIYAPNGFGKTSFYDAVEWTITGQIERFHRNASEFDKTAKENRKNNPENPFFLQHKGTSDLGYVNVNTDGEKNYNRKLTSSKVYNFKSKPENIFFKDVLLSQDLIDSFIKEEKAEDRYKKFISSFPSLTQYNTKLENLTKLIEFTNGKITNELKPQKEKLNGVQLKLDYQGDNKVIEEINKSIQFLISKKENLSLIIAETTTEKDFQLLHSKVESELVQLDFSLNEKKEKITNLENAYNGVSSNDSQILGVFNYFNTKERVDVQEKDLKLFENYKSKINKAHDISKIIEIQKTRKENNLNIKETLKNYNLFQVAIEIAKSEITKNNSTLNKHQQELRDIQNNQQENRNTLQSLNTELLNNQNRLKNISTNEKRLKELNLELEVIEKNKILLNDKTNEQRDLQKQIELFGYHSNLINSDISLLKEFAEYEEQKGNIIEIEKINIEIESLNEKKQTTELQISEQNKLKEELSDYIAKGMEIINEKHSDTCPLCTQKYESFETLTQKILGNNLIDENTKILLKTLSDIDIALTKINTTKSDLEKIIRVFFEKKIEIFQKKYLELGQEVLKLSEKLSQQDNFQKERNQIILFFGDFTPQNFEQHLNSTISSLFLRIKDIEKRLDENEKSFQKTNSNILTLNSSNKSLNEEINNSKKEPIYLEVNRYFTDNLNSETVSPKLLDDEAIEIENTINKNTFLLNQINKDIKDIESKLHVYNQDIADINNHISNLNNTITLNKKPVSDFEQFLYTNFDISLQNKSKVEVDNDFNKERKLINDEIKSAQEKIKHYAIIGKLREPTLSYLTLEKTKKDIVKINEEITTIEKIYKNLESEKKNLEEYLKKEIDDFFFTELISSIYGKIDPHPDYNRIEFKCDFSDAQPRLQIYTIDKNGKDSVPALYFSTAQINILSLSIFLARALNAKDDKGNPIDCIFIDDPIQSMDSINVLSFIDLFRSIVINFKKQIIVSTHEENFHLLLQKKIPKNLFKSKFIEFETFGKLAV